MLVIVLNNLLCVTYSYYIARRTFFNDESKRCNGHNRPAPPIDTRFRYNPKPLAAVWTLGHPHVKGGR